MSILQRWKKLGSYVRYILRRFQGKSTRTPPPPPLWQPVLKPTEAQWAAARQNARQTSGKRVLVATSMGGIHTSDGTFIASIVESALAVALTLRGASVDVLLCDKALPACQFSDIDNLPLEVMGVRPQPRCASCYAASQNIFAELDIPLHWYSQYISDAEQQMAQQLAQTLPLENIKTYRYENLAVGEHALAGVLRFYARGDLQGEPHGEHILRQYLLAALLTVFATRNVLRQHQYEVAVLHHGIYVPQGLIGEVCRQEGLRVVTWNPAYRKHSFIFSHDDSYHHTMISEPVSAWENLPWSAERETETLDYLASRRQGTQDWIWFHTEPQEALNLIERETGLDFARPVIALLTNVVWDAQLHYQDNAFPSMIDWVVATIRYFATRPELQLAIRIHPAEVTGFTPSRQRMVDEIQRAIPVLPPNVKVIAPESTVSTYTLTEHSNAVIIYNTKTGIEVASMGIPVVVAGEAWIRNKGFALDVTSRDQYFQLLGQLPLQAKMTDEATTRARRYAYHFFFRRMIPLPFIVASGRALFGLNLKDVMGLAAGQDTGLDVVCDGILNGTPFIYLAERRPCVRLQNSAR